MRRMPSLVLWSMAALATAGAAIVAGWWMVPRLAPEWTSRHAPAAALRAEAALRYWSPWFRPLALTAPPWPSLPPVHPQWLAYIVQQGWGDPVPTLIAAARRPAEPGAAFVAVIMLAEIAQDRCEQRVRDALLDAATAGGAGTRIQALLALAGLGDDRALPAVEALAELGSAGVRCDAIRWLGCWGDAVAISPWDRSGRGLRAEPWDRRSGASAAVPVLVRCLDDGDGAVRRAALAALARIHDESVGDEVAERLAAAQPGAEMLAWFADWRHPAVRAAVAALTGPPAAAPAAAR